MRTLAHSALLLLLLSPLASAGPIYKWVDAQGVTHFDAQPPVGRESTKIAPVKPVPLPSTAADSAPMQRPNGAGASEQRTIDRGVKRDVNRANARMREVCTKARSDISQLRNNPRINQEINGRTVRMSEADRQSQIRDLQEMIDQSCS